MPASQSIEMTLVLFYAGSSLSLVPVWPPPELVMAVLTRCSVYPAVDNRVSLEGGHGDPQQPADTFEQFVRINLISTSFSKWSSLGSRKRRANFESQRLVRLPVGVRIGTVPKKILTLRRCALEA